MGEGPGFLVGGPGQGSRVLELYIVDCSCEVPVLWPLQWLAVGGVQAMCSAPRGLEANLDGPLRGGPGFQWFCRVVVEAVEAMPLCVAGLDVRLGGPVGAGPGV